MRLAARDSLWDAVPKIKYIESNGTEHVADVSCGKTVMQGALDHGIPGILAECGGSCSCGTCRVHIDDAWRARTGEPSEIEDATMDGHDDTHPAKRLSCQITVTQALDGLIVRLPASQL
ncbi:MAG TPA: 2Fe-2S iron-sulfur cluster-binding protein [Steroidobacteraceae bacterium]|nr:2Fe-2S iron-sulfur cluster-binding protein [Steroidobacteraceae bacterium]